MPRASTDEGRREVLAVNLFDLDRLSDDVRNRLRPNLDLRRDGVIRVDDRRLQETAIRFTCGLLVAAAIGDQLRGYDRRDGMPPTRLYLKREVVWNRVPDIHLLTLLVGGKLILNPDVFSAEVKFTPVAPDDMRIE